MTFTYNLSNDIGKLRCEIPDTVQAKAKFTDEELSYLLTKANNDLYLAKLYAVEILCSLSAELCATDVKVGDITTKNSSDYGSNWCELAKQMRENLANGIQPDSAIGLNPFYYAGGVYQEDREDTNEYILDGTYVERSFWNNYTDADDESGLS